MKFKDNFYKEVESRLPKEIVDFWGLRNIHKVCLEYNSLRNFTKMTIDSVFEDIPENKLADEINKIRKSYRKKRFDWSKRYYDSLKLNYSDSSHPLFNEILTLKESSPTTLILQYKDLPIEDIIQSKIDERNEKIEEWKDKKGLLISFPAQSILSSTIKEKGLKDDIIKITCDYIVKELKYNFTTNAKLLPSPIVDKPLFGINSVRIPLEEINGVIQSVIQNQNNGSTLTMIPKSTSSDTQIKSLNKKDLAVYQEITKLATTSGIVQNGKIMVKINPYTVASNIWGYQVNSKDAMAVLNSIDNLANRRFIYTNNEGQSIDYVLIDTIVKNEAWSDDSVDYQYILLGNTMSEAILQKDIIGVSKKLEDKITVSNAKAFLHALQAKRFETYRDNPDDMTLKITMNFFEESTFFSTKSYKKKVAIVMECLDDYVSREILLETYSYEDDVFTLKFITLDDDDKQYYNDWIINHKAM